MSTEQTAAGQTAEKAPSTDDKASTGNGAQQAGPGPAPRVSSNPNDVASLVLMQVDAVNAKKDELTIAMKGLTDLTKQRGRAYGEHTETIQRLQERFKVLEAKAETVT